MMKVNSNGFQRIAGVVLILVLLGIMVHLRASQNYKNQNYRHSNFFVLWLSGRMIVEGQNPYDPGQWSAGHEKYGATILREPSFLYPLPLAVFLVPLGLMSVDQAYLFWQIFCQLAVAFVIFILLRRWPATADQRLLIPIMLFLLYFGPFYLTLQIGSIGPLTLLLILAVMYFQKKDRSFLVGILFSLTLLKPPQGITILALIGFLFLVQRDWKAIAGVVTGGAFLWLVGAAIDPDWVRTFQQSSQTAFDRRLGVQSTVWSFSYIICNQNTKCYVWVGAAGMLLLLGATAYFLWRNHEKPGTWEAFNIILPVAFVSTIYLWAYDQLTYILPIVWIIGTLVERTRSYVYAFLFLIVVDLYSMYALLQQASTDKDLWSVGTTIIVLGTTLGLYYLNKIKPIDKASSTI